MVRERIVVQKILEYCKDIRITIKRFGNSKEKFIRDKDYFNSVCMSILQIGELSNYLADDVKKKYQRQYLGKA